MIPKLGTACETTTYKTFFYWREFMTKLNHGSSGISTFQLWKEHEPVPIAGQQPINVEGTYTPPPIDIHDSVAMIAARGFEEQSLKHNPQLTKPSPSGLKYDDGKPRYDLLDKVFLDGVATVLGFGARKYAANNWRGGINFSRLIAAAGRHLAAISNGEDIDPESGLRHVDHLGCCVMFLSNMMATRPDLDDRWKP